MDKATIQARIKWPNIPRCYGWLSLDRRGSWRLKNEFAQQHQLPGEEVVHPALKRAIQTHIAIDANHQYFFQNGPQQVYIDLAYTPYIVRLIPDAEHGWSLQTHLLQMVEPTRCLLDEKGNILFACHLPVHQQDPDQPSTFHLIEHPTVALLHDHDLEIFSTMAQMDIGSCGNAGIFQWRHLALPIEPMMAHEVSKTFHFRANASAD